MKQFSFLLLFLCSTFSFAQTKNNNYDFFVQYNGAQITKKVSAAEVLNHSLLQKLNKSSQFISNDELNAVVDLNKNATFLGNFTDSITYTQATIPLKDSALLREILLRQKESNDVIADDNKIEILDFGTFSMIKSDPNNKKGTLAWNKDFMVVFEYTTKFPRNAYAHSYDDEDYDDYSEEQEAYAVTDSAYIVVDTAAVGILNAEESYETVYDGPVETAVVSNVEAAEAYNTVEVVEETGEDQYDTEVVEMDEEDDSYETYLNNKALFEKTQTEKQVAYVKSLFNNGFTAPYSDKIDSKADISSWINYGSFLESTSNMYKNIRALSGLTNYFPKEYKFGDFVKGINLNAYFDNDNIRLEEIVEYNDEMASIMQKVTNRKVNKNIYAYFPAEKPLAYMSYHLNTKELLTNIPSFINQFLGGQSEFNKDVALSIDLISTLVDEEATSTLFDGDLSFFLHNVKKVDITTKTYEYDENYESQEIENTTTKSIPFFSMVFTSTHPTFGDKLIQLLVRKEFLQADGDLYYFTKTTEYGDFFILKDKDVIVIGNVPDAFDKFSNGGFVKDIKSKLSKNSLMAAVNFEQLAKSYQEQVKNQSNDDAKLIKLSHQFNRLEMQSPKKLKNNKLRFDMRLNAVKDNKNIILQFLDAFEEMK